MTGALSLLDFSNGNRGQGELRGNARASRNFLTSEGIWILTSSQIRYILALIDLKAIYADEIQIVLGNI